MIGLLIVTVIGVGGPRVAQPHALPNATVSVEPALWTARSHPAPLRFRVNRQGRIVLHPHPGRYRVSAALLDSSPPVWCSSRTVIMTGKTQRVRLTCSIR